MTRFLNEYQSKCALRDARLPTGDFTLAATAEAAVAAAEGYGYPVVMKIVSDQIVHKTEAGGVRLGVMGAEEARTAFETLVQNGKRYKSDAVIDGVLVSPMVPPGVECIVGGLRDAQFGPVVMFGLGGVFVEIFKDVKFRMAPVTKQEAIKTIRAIQGFPMLDGARGRQKANLDALAAVLVRVSEYLSAHEEVKELDLNPVVCYDDKVQLLDASIGIEG